MDIRQLEYFLVLTEKGNYSKAAESLFLSRQGLRKSIDSLEKEVGIQLFIRDGNSFSLTEGGRIFHSHAAGIVRQYRQIGLDLRDYIEKRQKSVKFILPYGFWSNVPVTILQSWQEANPEIALFTSYASDEDCMALLEKGEHDLAVTTSPERLPQFDYHPLFRNYRCIAAVPGHPDFPADRVRTKDLDGVHITVPSNGHFDYHWFAEICRNAGVTPDIHPIADTQSAMLLARAGYAPVLFVGNIGEECYGIGNSRFIFWEEEELPQTCFQVCIATPHGKLSEPVKTLIRHLQAQCAELTARLKFYPYDRPDGSAG